MAEGSSKLTGSSQASVSKRETNFRDCEMSKMDHSPIDIPECAVCLQSCIHPVKLPCNHIFCFLCVKGAANQSRRCALCRQAIPAEFFNNPTLVDKKDESTLGKEVELDLELELEQYAWYYEGRNGWWQYDQRTNADLEESYNAKKRIFDLLIAGYMYVIDLDNMVQMRRNDPSRRRRIKRDLINAPKKGIAGLKISGQVEHEEETTEDQGITQPVAAGGGVRLPTGNDGKTAHAGSTHQAQARSSGVGRDHSSVLVNPSLVSVDQYDADDDYDGTDEESDESRREQRLRTNRRRGNRDDLEVVETSHTVSRQRPIPRPRTLNQGTSTRHQAMRSAPDEDTPMDGYEPLIITNPTRPSSDNPQDVLDVTGVDSAMHSLHLSRTDDATAVSEQLSQGEVRHRRRPQRHHTNVDL